MHRYRWNYDALGRLTQESFDDGDNGATAKDYIDRFAFELTGNRLQKTRDGGNADPASFFADETTGYSYDANDRLLWETKDVADGWENDTNTVYEYGPNNTQTAQTGHTELKGSTSLGIGTQIKQQTFVYNRQGRLKEATTIENGSPVQTHYEYDANGVRISLDIGIETGPTPPARSALNSGPPQRTS